MDYEQNLPIYGRNAVQELLQSGAEVDTVFISNNMQESQAAFFTALAKEAGAVVKKVHAAKLQSLCQSEKHQGIAAFASMVEYVDYKEILQIAKTKNEPPFILLADGVEDPYNLGAIIRTAYLLGVHGVVIPKRGGASITAAVHKASAGAAVHMPVARVSNIGETIRRLKEENIFVYCADMNGTPLRKNNLTGAIALVVGAEGKGVSPLVRKLCDGTILIEMYAGNDAADHGVDSFNVSVAAGIVLYEIQRQRENKAEGKQ